MQVILDSNCCVRMHMLYRGMPTLYGTQSNLQTRMMQQLKRIFDQADSYESLEEYFHYEEGQELHLTHLFWLMSSDDAQSANNHHPARQFA